MENVGSEMEILKENKTKQRETLEIQTLQQRWEEFLRWDYQSPTQGRKSHPRSVGQLQKVLTPTYKNTRRRRKKVAEDIFETITTENFPQIHVSHWITDPGSSNIQQNRHQKITCRHFIFKL